MSKMKKVSPVEKHIKKLTWNLKETFFIDKYTWKCLK